MELVNDKQIRTSIVSKQRQLRIVTLRGEPGDDIANEIKSLAQDAVEHLVERFAIGPSSDFSAK